MGLKEFDCGSCDGVTYLIREPTRGPPICSDCKRKAQRERDQKRSGGRMTKRDWVKRAARSQNSTFSARSLGYKVDETPGTVGRYLRQLINDGEVEVVSEYPCRKYRWVGEG